MAKIIGSRINLGVAREATRGVCLKPQRWIPWVNIGFTDKVTSVNSGEALGVLEDSHEKSVVEKYGEGDIEFEVRDQSYGYFLYALMGTLTGSVAVVANSYDHTFNIANTNQHQSLSLSTEDPNGDKQFCLSMIDKLTLNMVLGDYVKSTIGFISRGSHDTNVDSNTGDFAVENKFRAQDIEFKVATTRAGLAAAGLVKLQSLSLMVNKNILRKQMLGTVQPDDLINQGFQIEGEFTLPYEDQTYRDLMLDNTYNAMEIIIRNEDVELADGAGVNPTITIVLPRCGFMDWTPDRPKGELAEQTIGFKGYYDFANTENSIYSIVLRNDKADYTT